MTQIQPRPVPDWFRNAKFGMFVHWGLYAVTGHGEQPLFREFLTPSEYYALADTWRAERYDPSEWAAVAKAAGMKYAVLTTKHHDGFCLWDTATTRLNAVRTGPGRDLVAEYVTAMREAGIRVGLYFSPPDWSRPELFAGREPDPAGFRDYMRMTWQQLEELMANYGRIDLLWFDGASFPTAADWRSTQLIKMIRGHQPDILINNRLPKPKRGGDWGYETPEQRIGAMSTQPWESCITATRKFWGWHHCHADESQWLTEREALTTLATVISRGGNLLFNVGPYASGELPQLYKDRVAAMGDWLRRNKRAVYGTEPADFEFMYGGVMTKKASKLYAIFLYWPGEEYSIPGFNERLKSARFLEDGRRIQAVQEPHRVVLKGLPKNEPAPLTVVELTFDAPPTAHPWAQHRLHEFPMPGLENWTKL